MKAAGQQGVALTGRLYWCEKRQDVCCIANNYSELKLYGIVCYENIAHTGKRVAQFLVEKGHLKSKREFPLDPLKNKTS